MAQHPKASAPRHTAAQCEHAAGPRQAVAITHLISFMASFTPAQSSKAGGEGNGVVWCGRTRGHCRTCWCSWSLLCPLLLFALLCLALHGQSAQHVEPRQVQHLFPMCSQFDLRAAGSMSFTRAWMIKKLRQGLVGARDWVQIERSCSTGARRKAQARGIVKHVRGWNSSVPGATGKARSRRLGESPLRCRAAHP